MQKDSLRQCQQTLSLSCHVTEEVAPWQNDTYLGNSPHIFHICACTAQIFCK